MALAAPMGCDAGRSGTHAMNVVVDLILTEDGYIAKAPMFGAWCFKPTDRNADAATVRKGAEQSLRKHIGRVLTFSWNGWGGETS
jgi:hypothetical protein